MLHVIRRLHHAVAEARPDVDIWLDANQSYRPVHLETFLKQIDNLTQVRCLEQPVKSVDGLGLRRARERSRLPIALDEGCFSSYDVARLARLEAGDLIWPEGGDPQGAIPADAALDFSTLVAEPQPASATTPVPPTLACGGVPDCHRSRKSWYRRQTESRRTRRTQ